MPSLERDGDVFRVRLSDENKVALFDAFERANKRFALRARDVAAMPASEWKRGWLEAYGEHEDFDREETR